MYRLRKKTSQSMKILLHMLVLLFAGLCTNPAYAQSVDISCGQPLIFGELIPCGSAGTVILRPDDSGPIASCVVLGSAPTSIGRCIVTQEFDAGFRPMQIDVTSSSISLTSGANSMTVNAFNLITNSGGDSVVVPGGPVVDVPIGATLNVGASQSPGTYAGTFTVEVTLQ